MKQFLSIFILAFSFYAAVAQSEVTGTVSLVGTDFTAGETAVLSGNWHFYFGEHLSLESLELKPDVTETYVPDSWYGHEWKGQTLPDRGIATYHARVVLGKRYESLALKIPEQANAYKLFINGNMILEVGKLGQNAQQSKPSSKSQIISIPIHGDVFDIVIHISNFYHKKGGVWDAITIGEKEVLQEKRLQGLLYDAFLIGAILIIALYHVGIYLLRPKDKSALYFSALAIMAACRLAATGEMLILYLFPNMDWEWRMSMEHIPFYMLIGLGLMFSQTLYPHEFSKKIILPAFVFSLLLSIANLFSPAIFNSYFILPFEIVLIAELIYMTWALIIGIRNKRPSIIPYSLGFLVIFAAAINDILYSNNAIHTFYMAPIGIFLFFFSEAFVLSVKSASAFNKAEDLSEELINSNENLESKVRLRTASLEEKSKELALANTELQALAEELEANADSLRETNQNLEQTKGQLEITLQSEISSKQVIEQTLNQLKSAQGQLVQAEKMASLGQLVAGIAHEINNPINFVNSGADILQTIWQDMQVIMTHYDELEQVLDPASIRHLLKDIKELKEKVGYQEMQEDVVATLADIRHGAERTIEIVKGLRTFSRTDDKTAIITDIHDCLDSTLIILKNQYKNRIDLQKDYASNMPRISCKAGQINQVFMNLLANAIQAIPDKGEIRISTQMDGSFVKVSIQDSGTGIPEEVKSKIFDPFFTTKEIGKGTGLGLSISHNIILEHGGTIEVESEQGKGTTFIIRLPA